MEKKKQDSLNDQDGEVLLGLARMTIAKKLGCPVDEHRFQRIRKSLDQEQFQKFRGVFVTLHIHGRLRGCIGSLDSHESIRDGVRGNALNAAFNDPRFSSLTSEELEEMEIEVSILTKPRSLVYKTGRELLSSLVPGLDGVVLKKGSAKATFLPQVWEQLSDTEMFLGQLCLKAGLSRNEWKRGKLAIQRYRVHCFQEPKDLPGLNSESAG